MAIINTLKQPKLGHRMSADDVKTELQTYVDKKAAELASRYFKTYDGGYAANDQFLELKVPVTRAVAKQFKNLSLNEIEKLLASPIHEHRQAGLMIVTMQMKKASLVDQKRLYDFYLQHTDRVNNWDLVDGSAPAIVGAYLIDKPRKILYKLAKSDDIWERRIAMVATWEFIRGRQLDDTFAIAGLLLNDKQDLIHKAVGWMLREAGKRDQVRLVQFLDLHAHEMPRTALRYAIEHFSQADRQHYLQARIASGARKDRGL